MTALATIIQSGLCRTKVHPRPCPTLFYFPGLSSKPVFENNKEFKDVENLLQSNFQVILDEYNFVQSSIGPKSDYKLGNDEHKLHDGKWDWTSYILKGIEQENFLEKCPQTSKILNSIPGLIRKIPFSYAFFSTLHANSIINSHSGPCNLRIRCHFPLIVPSLPSVNTSETSNELLGMEVGGVNLSWQTGVPIFFDDCYEHHVWNKTNSDRVVLLFDMWHPELTTGERQAIIDMFGYAQTKGWLKK